MLQGTVTIGAKQWQVNIATTYQDLTTGLGGLASLPAGTGMLFDLGSDQTLYVTTAPMLFALDIVFISSDLKVTELAAGVAPGYLVTSSLPGRFFLEMNAGEAAGIQPGDSVSIVQTGGQAATQSSVSDALTAFIPNLVNAVMFGAMFYGMMAMMGWMREKEIAGTEAKKPLKPPEPLFLEVSPRYIYWPPYAGNLDKTARLVKSVDDYESTGAKVKPDMVVLLAQDVGLKITQAEAEQFVQIRRQPAVAQQHRMVTDEQRMPKATRFIGSCEVAPPVFTDARWPFGEGFCLTHMSPVSRDVKCPKSPLSQEEWQAAWDLVQVAFPQAIPRTGWVPKTREEAEKAAYQYSMSVQNAVRHYALQTDMAVENYHRAADKACADYRAYVMRLYYEGAGTATAQTQTTMAKQAPKGAAPAAPVTPAEQGKKLTLKHGKYPKRDDALARFNSYTVVEVHDDGDLTIASGDLTYVVTTDGVVFKQAEYTGGYAQSGFFADTSASIQASIARISHYPHLEETFRSAIKRVNRRSS